MKNFLKLVTFQTAIALLITPLILKACDNEYEYQYAKYDQWKDEREKGIPYTSFSE